MAGDDAQVLELAGHEVRITSPDKVFFSERGETKLDLVDYYAARRRAADARDGRPAGADAALPARRRGPVVLPEARAGGRARWLETTTVQTVNGTTSRALVAADLAHVAWAVNLGCLGFHVWPYLRRRPRARRRAAPRPRPPAGHRLRRCARGRVRAQGAARRARHRRLPEDDRQPRAPRVRPAEPRWDSYEVRSAAVAVARELERRRPDLITAAWWKEERGERIFVDFNQNAPHKTVFGAWSVRAPPGAQVSTPLAGTSSTTSHPDDLTIATVPAASSATATRGPTIDDARSRSSRCSRCTSATARTA